MIKVAILGYGFMGKVHARAYASIPGVRVCAVATRKPPAERESLPDDVASFADWEKAIRDGGADAVDICLPTFLHEAAVCAACECGLHVICEKPIALTTAEADRMIAAAERAGTVFMVAQVLRFFAHYAKISELIQGGEVGEVFYASAQRFSEPPQWANWFQDANASGGALFDLHIHDLDFLLSTFGLPQAIYARGSRSASGAWDQVTNVLSCGSATLLGEAGYRMPTGWPFTTAFRAVGTEGSIDYSFRVKGNVDKAGEAENRLMLYRNRHSPVRIDIEDPDPYRRQLEYFLRCVETGEQAAAVTPRESRNAIAVLEASLRSLESGEQVRLQNSEFL